MLARRCGAPPSRPRADGRARPAAARRPASASACEPCDQHRELVAADPRQDQSTRRRAWRSRRATRWSDQVAELVAERVVDRLEVVEVEQHHGQRRGRRARRRPAPPGGSRSATSGWAGRSARRGGPGGSRSPPAGRRSTPPASARSTPGRAPRSRRPRRPAPARRPARSRPSRPGRPGRRAGSATIGRRASSAPATHASTWLVTKNAVAASSTIGSSPPVIAARAGATSASSRTPAAATHREQVLRRVEQDLERRDAPDHVGDHRARDVDERGRARAEPQQDRERERGRDRDPRQPAAARHRDRQQLAGQHERRQDDEQRRRARPATPATHGTARPGLPPSHGDQRHVQDERVRRRVLARARAQPPQHGCHRRAQAILWPAACATTRRPRLARFDLAGCVARMRRLRRSPDERSPQTANGDRHPGRQNERTCPPPPMTVDISTHSSTSLLCLRPPPATRHVVCTVYSRGIGAPRRRA